VNPRAEAQARAGDAYAARVLEPSPPTVTTGPWFADDPLARDAATRPLLSPVSGGDVTWASIAAGDPELEAWCRERWLGPFPPLDDVPAGYEATRRALHAVAEHVVARARERANGKFGLRYVLGGFGTPFFGDDVQVAVRGATLHVLRGPETSSTPLTSLADVVRTLADLGIEVPAGAAGTPIELEVPPAGLDDAPLEIDPAAARFVGDWFGFGCSALEELRARAGCEHEPSRVQIWPEHFDTAVELGDDSSGARAAYGCSPGDDLHPEPYVYVAPWTAPAPGELWQATAFAGAELSYAELLAAPDPRALALDFLGARLAARTGGS
jgi:hypothetical protein